MQADDLPAVLAIQSRCYIDIEPESDGSMRAKLLASPATCFVADAGQGPCAYLLALPWRLHHPPLLNAPDCKLPPAPDTLYLHDLAVSPQARGNGSAALLIGAFFRARVRQALPSASLVAIQNSAPFWRRHGFEVVAPGASLKAKLASYGQGVHYMVSTTPPRSERHAARATPEAVAP